MSIGNLIPKTTPITFSDSLYLSEFAELRTSNPGNRFDFDFWSADQGGLLVDDISSGGGAATFDTNARDYVLSLGNTTLGTTGGKSGHYPVPYTPGSGQEVEHTGTFDFANLGGTMHAFLRSTVSGTTTLETVPQSSWTAASTGVNWQYSQIMRISFQSLRVGRIQFSMVRGGVATKVCEITNDNERATGYWQTANLRPSWVIFNEAGNTITEFRYGDEYNSIGWRYVFNGLQSTATARAICGTVKSQGGFPVLDMPGLPFCTPRLAAKTVQATLIPIISIRVASLFATLANNALVIPTSYSLQTDNPIDYEIYYRPTLTGANFTAINATYNGVEYDNTASSISGGYLIDADSLSAGTNQVTGEAGLLGRVIMSIGATGSQDILTLAAIRSGASSASVKVYIKGKEIR